MSTDIQRPPRGWESQTWLLTAVAAAAAVLGLIELVALLDIRSALLSGEIDDLAPVTSLVLRNGDALDVTYFVLMAACLGVFFWWRKSTRALLERFGDGGELDHWTLRLWNRLLVASIVIRLVANRIPDDSREMLDIVLILTALGLALRLIAVTVMTVGAWQVRARLRALIADPPAPALPRPTGQQWVTTDRPTSLDTTGLLLADDDFWDRVRAMSVAANGELPLLESSTTVIRRWSLIPSASAVDDLRAALRPGTVVTVFPTTPQPGSTPFVRHFPVDDDPELLGLTEDTDTGTLWFQLVPANRIPAWIAKAQRAKRYALYRADDPAAATAVIPAIHPEPIPAS